MQIGWTNRLGSTLFVVVALYILAAESGVSTLLITALLVIGMLLDYAQFSVRRMALLRLLQEQQDQKRQPPDPITNACVHHYTHHVETDECDCECGCCESSA